NEAISSDYLNKLLIGDLEKLFRQSSFDFEIFPQPFGSKYARWTRMFLKVPWFREFITSYLWVVLTKRPSRRANAAPVGDLNKQRGRPHDALLAPTMKGAAAL